MAGHRDGWHSKRWWVKVGRRLVVYVLVAVAAWFGGVWLLQRRAIYPRPALTAAQRLAVWPADGQAIDLRIPGGVVQGLFLPGKGVSDAHPGPVVMFAHGNGELIDDWVGALDEYRRHGVSVFLGEYRGYGRSAGSPSETAIVGDYVKFYDKLAARKDVDARRIVLHGRSLGGGVVAQLAMRRKTAALILQSTFTSVTAVAARFGVPWFLVRDPYPVLPVVKSYRGPVLIIAGERDHVVPMRYSKQLHAAAKGSELLVLPMGHNDAPPEPTYWNHVIGFLRKAGVIKDLSR